MKIIFVDRKSKRDPGMKHSGTPDLKSAGFDL